MKNHRLDFVVVGPPKAGTTWIHEYLLRHKSVCLPKGVKETYFFNRKYDKGLKWYFSHFQTANGNKIAGEITPNYFHSPEATIRIHDINPNCKIICTLRDPVERCFSNYLHIKRYGYIKPRTQFREATAERPSLIESSRYYTHISRWLKYFGKENVCILMYDNLKRNPANFSKILCNFLGLEEENFPEELKQAVNVRKFPINFTLARISHRLANLLEDYKFYSVINASKKLGLKKMILGGREIHEELSEEDRIFLYDSLKDEMENLEKLLFLDLLSWKSYSMCPE